MGAHLAPSGKTSRRGLGVKNRRWSVTARTLAAVASLGVGTYVAVCLYAANTLSVTGAHKPLTATAGSIGANWEDVRFPSRLDHIALRGWLFKAGIVVAAA
jgi:hypothetical protein